MRRVSLEADIHPLSDLRSNFSRYVNQVHDTKRPIVVTQHGRSAAVLLDVSEYERMVEQLELIDDLRRASEQIGQGQGIPHAKAKARLRKRRRIS